MRALDRLALYSTCTATAVILASTALIVHQLPHWDKFSEPRIREQPIVKAVDLSRLTPDIRQAIEQARS